uniref:Uncharacterized protein n=1 Tax=Rhizophora mucronata TaxID=61149 RepID=A0A2P2MUR0_RHIMU
MLLPVVSLFLSDQCCHCLKINETNLVASETFWKPFG